MAKHKVTIAIQVQYICKAKTPELAILMLAEDIQELYDKANEHGTADILSVIAMPD